MSIIKKNKMRTTFIAFLVFSLFSLSLSSMNKSKSIKDTIQNGRKCSVEKLIVKTERFEKDRKFLFWKLPHKKITLIDRIINTDGKVILKKSSILICSSDACDYRRFCRIKIVGNEIWIFQYNKDPEKGVIKRYDFCKKYISTKIWDKESLIDD